MSFNDPILELEAVTRSYRLPRRHLFEQPTVVDAVKAASLVVAPGEALGIVGESGSGKSTLARLAMAFERPDAGAVRFRGTDFAGLLPDALRSIRAGFQMIFQDPFSSLDPRRPIGWSVAEPLLATANMTLVQRRDATRAILDRVGLHPSDMDKYPHEFSGGQRQRIAIARAVVTRPALLVADEPVASLDVSVQAQILNLFMDLQEDMGLSILFISHDLAVVSCLCDRIAVMQAGTIFETGATRSVVNAPKHAYTRALFEAA